jgi:AcrR family transcriptional regulator
VAVTRTPRESWIEGGLRALALGGPDAVRVESLAQKLGVTKGGFYWNFDGRQSLLDAILDEWERIVVEEVIERVEADGGDGRTRLRRLFALASSDEARAPLTVDLAIRDWARRDKSVARRLRRVDNRRMEYMRTLFRDFCEDEEDVEVRCLVVFSLFIGTRYITAEHPGRRRRDVLDLALRRLEE